MNTRVLVLNASFEPINVCTARRAVVLLLKGVAHAEECTSHWVHSSRFSMPMPSVIRLLEYIHIPFERKSLSRKNILLRDHNTCQYCRRVFPPPELTLDHIVPRSRGGDSTWDNLVTSCRDCNLEKGFRLPDECGMSLRTLPTRPGWSAALRMAAPTKRYPEWTPFLGQLEAIDEAAEE